jgi:hypothetical protein
VKNDINVKKVYTHSRPGKIEKQQQKNLKKQQQKKSLERP